MSPPQRRLPSLRSRVRTRACPNGEPLTTRDQVVLVQRRPDFWLRPEQGAPLVFPSTYHRFLAGRVGRQELQGIVQQLNKLYAEAIAAEKPSVLLTLAPVVAFLLFVGSLVLSALVSEYFLLLALVCLFLTLAGTGVRQEQYDRSVRVASTKLNQYLGNINRTPHWTSRGVRFAVSQHHRGNGAGSYSNLLFFTITLDPMDIQFETTMPDDQVEYELGIHNPYRRRRPLVAVSAPSIPAQALFEAIEKGDVPLVGRLLQAGAPVNEKNARNEYPLHVAARVGNILIVRMLLAAGSNDAMLNPYDQSPAEVADARGNRRCVELLLSARQASEADLLAASEDPQQAQSDRQSRSGDIAAARPSSTADKWARGFGKALLQRAGRPPRSAAADASSTGDGTRSSSDDVRTVSFQPPPQLDGGAVAPAELQEQTAEMIVADATARAGDITDRAAHQDEPDPRDPAFAAVSDVRHADDVLALIAAASPEDTPRTRADAEVATIVAQAEAVAAERAGAPGNDDVLGDCSLGATAVDEQDDAAVLSPRLMSPVAMLGDPQASEVAAIVRAASMRALTAADTGTGTGTGSSSGGGSGNGDLDVTSMAAARVANMRKVSFVLRHGHDAVVSDMDADDSAVKQRAEHERQDAVVADIIAAAEDSVRVARQ